MILLVVGSICSGMGTGMFALRSILGEAFINNHVSQAFHCEINKHAQRFHADNWKGGGVLCEDVSHKAFRKAPAVDLLTAGFPCQPFSLAGLGEGTADSQGRGTVIYNIISYMRRTHPQTVVLENVEGLLTCHVQPFYQILTLIRNIKTPSGNNFYNVQWELLNTRIHGGLPQNRPRLYIVAHHQSNKRKFKMHWPKPIEMTKLKRVLDFKRGTLDDRLLLPNANAAKKKVQVVLEAMQEQGIFATRVPVAIDCHSSKVHWCLGYTPCLTAARGMQGGFWVTYRNHGLLSIGEMLRLQGFSPEEVIINNIAKTHMGKMLGNAFTQTVMERVLLPLLHSTGQLRNVRLRDRWA